MFVCTEVLRHLLKFEIERKGKIASIDQLNQTLTQLQLDLTDSETKRNQSKIELKKLGHQIETAKAELRQVKKETKPANISDDTKQLAFYILSEWEAQNVPLNRKGAMLAREMSDRLGRNVSRRTGLNLLNEYQTMGTDSPKDGNGTQKTGLIDRLPMDQMEKGVLKRSVEYFKNGQGQQ